MIVSDPSPYRADVSFYGNIPWQLQALFTTMTGPGRSTEFAYTYDNQYHYCFVYGTEWIWGEPVWVDQVRRIWEAGKSFLQVPDPLRHELELIVLGWECLMEWEISHNLHDITRIPERLRKQLGLAPSVDSATPAGSPAG